MMSQYYLSSSWKTVVSLLVCLMFLTSALGESGWNENQETEEPTNSTEVFANSTDDGCTNDSPLWVQYLYNVHYHQQGNTHISVGVNVSMEKAVHNDGLNFRQLLVKPKHNKLIEAGDCKEGDHVAQHAQQYDQACPWEYRCDYNPRRFPAYVYQAACKHQYWVRRDNTLHRCREVYYPITTIHTSECNPLKTTIDWEWKIEMVSVACA